MMEDVNKLSATLDKEAEKYRALQQNYEIVQTELAELKSKNVQLEISNKKIIADKIPLTDENSQILSKTTQIEAQLIDVKKSADECSEQKRTRQDSCSSHSASSESDVINNPNSTSGTLKRRVLYFCDSLAQKACFLNLNDR